MAVTSELIEDRLSRRDAHQRLHPFVVFLCQPGETDTPVLESVSGLREMLERSLDEDLLPN